MYGFVLPALGFIILAAVAVCGWLIYTEPEDKVAPSDMAGLAPEAKSRPVLVRASGRRR